MCASKRFTVDVGLLLLNVASDPDNVKMSEYTMLFFRKSISNVMQMHIVGKFQLRK